MTEKKNCPFCGAELVEKDGKMTCPNMEQHFKRMCINCVFNQNGYCMNPLNMDAAKAKIMQNLPSGYEIEELKLKPLPLRDETKKCGNWVLDEEFMKSAVIVLAH